MSWSVYSQSTLKQYFDEGRLFAWHLFLEAQRIFPDKGQPLLQKLGPPAPYTTASSDLCELQEILAGALGELQRGTESLIYELGVVYTSLRDIAMSASWGLSGRPNFSRDAPYSLPCVCPLPLDAYRATMAARHQSTRGIPCELEFEGLVEVVTTSPLVEWVETLRRGICATHS